MYVYSVLKLWLGKRNINCPQFNFKYYNNFSLEPDIKKFMTLLKQIINDKQIYKDEINVCIISHGTFIRTSVNEYFYGKSLDVKLDNTEIVKFIYLNR